MHDFGMPITGSSEQCAVIVGLHVRSGCHKEMYKIDKVVFARPSERHVEFALSFTPARATTG
jgi:hypothetical protein